MNAENQREIWNEMRAMGDRLTGYLPPHRFHSKKGRNPYAHIALMIRCEFGMSYKDIPDEDVPRLKGYMKNMEAWEKRHGKRFQAEDFRVKVTREFDLRDD